MPRIPKALCLILSLAALPAAGDIAFVTNQNGEELSVLDLSAGTEINRIPLPGQPAGIAVHGTHIFTVSPEAKTVRRFDRATMTEQASVTLDGGPTGIAYDPTRDRLFISDWFNTRLWALDGATLTVQAELATGVSPSGIAVSDDGRWMASAD
ncbi:MAG: YncE family protein, partial [Pseudomonadota bacterium]|nr:YncE family protein [Pseudomonadota bacterium]